MSQNGKDQVAGRTTFKTVDLCAGIGGIRRGFELTGLFQNVLSAETEEWACRTYEHIYGENPRNDVTSADFKALMESTQYDVLLAGFTCQAFSRVGLEAGFVIQRTLVFSRTVLERTLLVLIVSGLTESCWSVCLRNFPRVEGKESMKI